MLVETVDFSAPAWGSAMGIARINGVALNGEAEKLSVEDLRQRACTELPRQACVRDGLLAASDAAAVGGAVSEAASQAIDTGLERALQLPEAADVACRRHHAAHAARYRTAGRVRVRQADRP